MDRCDSQKQLESRQRNVDLQCPFCVRYGEFWQHTHTSSRGFFVSRTPLGVKYFHEVPPEILLHLPKILIQLTDITLVQKCHNIDGPLSLTLQFKLVHLKSTFAGVRGGFFSLYELTYSPIFFDVFTIKYLFFSEQYLEITTK